MLRGETVNSLTCRIVFRAGDTQTEDGRSIAVLGGGLGFVRVILGQRQAVCINDLLPRSFISNYNLMLWAVIAHGFLTVTLVSAPEFRTLRKFYFPDLFFLRRQK